jgi:aminoglycoside 6'-N-acetyltransferase
MADPGPERPRALNLLRPKQGAAAFSSPDCLEGKPDPSPYHFRPFTRADLVMTAGWLRTPEVVRWWGVPEEQQTLLALDLDEPLMRQWIVEFERHPFAYAQAYPANAWPQPHLASLPPDAMVIDTFIGEPAMLGTGHGGAFLRLLAEMLLAEGAPAVAIDPALDNRRAQRAYARAGFVGQGVVETAEGPAALMLYRR